MPELLVCQGCGTTFEPEPTAYTAQCPECGRGHQPGAGCC